MKFLYSLRLEYITFYKEVPFWWKIFPSKVLSVLRGSIIYNFGDRSPSRQKIFLHIAGGLMEKFLEGIALLILWYLNPNENSNKYNSFFWVNLSLNRVLPSKTLPLNLSIFLLNIEYVFHFSVIFFFRLLLVLLWCDLFFQVPYQSLLEKWV